MDDDNKINNKDLQGNNQDNEDIDMSEENETDYTGFLLPIGIGLGVTFGIVFDNLAIGISFGVALGLVVGAVVDSSKKKK